MDTNELIERVRKIEIKTRGLTRQVFAGEYHSAFKGRGIAFSEVREYQYGDDIRSIDWNVTARFNHPYIKVFEEERELTVMLLVDVSGSRNFGTRGQLKKNMITEIAAVLSFSAIQNNDKIGVILFSDKVEKFIPPKKGRQHILRVIRELIEFKPGSNKTNLSEALRYFTNIVKKKSTAFLISDFMDFPENSNFIEGTGTLNYEDALNVAARKHDLIGLRVFDEREKQLPPVGLVKVKDAETGEETWIDTASKTTRERYARWQENMENKIKDTFSRNGIDAAAIHTGEDYVKPLIGLFKRR